MNRWISRLRLLLVTACIAALILLAMSSLFLWMQYAELETENKILEQEVLTLATRAERSEQQNRVLESKLSRTSSKLQMVQNEYSDLKHQFGGSTYRHQKRSAHSRSDSVAIEFVWNKTKNDVTRRDEFFDFFEIRNRIELPKWWRTELTEARKTKFKIFRVPYDWESAELEESDYSDLGQNVELIERNGKKYADLGGTEFWIPDPIGVPLGEEEHIAYAVKDDLAFFLVNCQLTVVNWRMEDRIWTKPVTYAHGLSGGQANWDSIVPTDDRRVFVFTGGTSGYSAHSFSLVDGKTIMEFKSN